MTEAEVLSFDDAKPDMSKFPAFPELNAILNRALNDPSFTHIRLIDGIGTTLFSHRQMREVEPELQRLRNFTQSDAEQQALQQILDFSDVVKREAHIFLVFLGD